MGLYDFLALGQWRMAPAMWGIFCLAAFIVGFSKTGMPGATIVAVPLMAMVIPAKTSVGVMLPIFMTADLISMLSWSRFARWRYCFPYLLFVAVGVWSSSFVSGTVDDSVFSAVIGWTVVTMLALNLAAEVLRRRRGRTAASEEPPAERPPLAHSAFFGTSTGLFSALANAAGPISTIYLIVSRLEKFQFLGTSAVCAFLMNWIKIPLFVSLGMVRADTLKLDLVAMPVVALGALAGICVARRLPQKAFKNIVLALAFLASLKLIF